MIDKSRKTILYIVLPVLLIVLAVACDGATVKQLGIFAISRNDVVLGQDGVSPIPIGDDLYMWTFADTLLGVRKKGAELTAGSTFNTAHLNINVVLSNSLAFSKSPSASRMPDLKMTFYREDNKIVPFVKHATGESPLIWRFWTTDGIKIGQYVYVYYMKIKKPYADAPFEEILEKGVGLARWKMPGDWEIGDPVRFERLGTLFPEGFPNFGDAVIQHDGYIYTIGHYIEKAGSIPITGKAKIARVLPRLIENRKDYRYLTQKGNWTPDINKAHGFFKGVTGECSLSYHAERKRFVIVFCEQFSGNIHLIQFDDFEALQSAASEIIYSPKPLREDPTGKLMYYSAKEIFYAHPFIYIIYIHPLIYQPILISVRL
jgi:hypothetical protein